MDLMSVTEVATALEVRRATVLELITSGTLPAQKVGRQYVIERADMLTYQRSRAGKQKPGPKPG